MPPPGITAGAPEEAAGLALPAPWPMTLGDAPTVKGPVVELPGRTEEAGVPLTIAAGEPTVPAAEPGPAPPIAGEPPAAGLGGGADRVSLPAFFLLRKQ